LGYLYFLFSEAKLLICITVGQYYLSLIFYALSEVPAATLFPLSGKKPTKFSEKHFWQRNCRVSHQAQNNLSTLDRKVTDKQINLRMQLKNYWVSVQCQTDPILTQWFYRMKREKAN